MEGGGWLGVGHRGCHTGLCLFGDRRPPPYPPPSPLRRPAPAPSFLPSRARTSESASPRVPPRDLQGWQGRRSKQRPPQVLSQIPRLAPRREALVRASPRLSLASAKLTAKGKGGPARPGPAHLPRAGQDSAVSGTGCWAAGVRMAAPRASRRRGMRVAEPTRTCGPRRPLLTTHPSKARGARGADSAVPFRFAGPPRGEGVAGPGRRGASAESGRVGRGGGPSAEPAAPHALRRLLGVRSTGSWPARPASGPPPPGGPACGRPFAPPRPHRRRRPPEGRLRPPGGRLRPSPRSAA